ncbi:MAG TPA: hypothetical protein VMT85_24935 [Thermoanaerobaculia bacterium]|nr:hypothetical protein [Thermoanaerobaculia bacterium]
MTGLDIIAGVIIMAVLWKMLPQYDQRAKSGELASREKEPATRSPILRRSGPRPLRERRRPAHPAVVPAPGGKLSRSPTAPR